jgi:hypothetical protein
MAEVGRGDQRRADIGAGDVLGRAAAFQRQFEHRHIVGDRGDGDDVVLLRLQRIGIRLVAQQRARGALLLHEGGDMQRRAALAVAGVDRST